MEGVGRGGMVALQSPVRYSRVDVLFRSNYMLDACPGQDLAPSLATPAAQLGVAVDCLCRCCLLLDDGAPVPEGDVGDVAKLVR